MNFRSLLSCRGASAKNGTKFGRDVDGANVVDVDQPMLREKCAHKHQGLSALTAPS